MIIDSFIEFWDVFYLTIIDVLPIALLIVVFQLFVLKEKIPHLKNVVFGFVLVIIGLAMFLMGLEKALFPIGQNMARQLAEPEFIKASSSNPDSWMAYYWIYIFAALIGFATTVAEPALIAVAMKAEEVSGKSMSQWGLRITVAIGVAFALALGTFRIVTGTPLYYYIMVGYLIVVVQTIFAPKKLIALAYDSGGVTTSTVTVPIVAALGIGLSSMVPGSNPAMDGFGLIAFASLFPIISVLGYVQIMNLVVKVRKK